ncbi:hypothetical protein B6U79_04075 [Candidatus Bathyarchaeota archaeon ex4484_231]|nr:MAG: hypothetical protein B6U79_04075 [Candidatus Bathyarchaeota archaeon ex4484_231]
MFPNEHDLPQRLFHEAINIFGNNQCFGASICNCWIMCSSEAERFKNFFLDVSILKVMRLTFNRLRFLGFRLMASTG